MRQVNVLLHIINDLFPRHCEPSLLVIASPSAEGRSNLGGGVFLGIASGLTPLAMTF